MGKLFKLEIRKILRQKSYYICAGIAILLTLLNGILFSSEGIEFGLMFAIQGATLSNIMILMAVFVPIYACDDYTNHTAKNIYAKGFSRSAVYYTKYLVSLVSSLLVVVLCFVTAGAIGMATAPDATIDWSLLISSVGLQILLMFAYHALYFGISMIVTKVGGSMALNILGPMLVFLLINLVLDIGKIDFDADQLFMNYYFRQVTGSDAADAGHGVIFGEAIPTHVVIKTVVISLIYPVVCLIGGWLLNRRKEF